jgi:hypothetical protein
VTLKALRLIVWLLFMASGVVVIPLSVAMCIAYFPGGIPILLGWLDWAEGIHGWMHGRTSLRGDPTRPTIHDAQGLSEHADTAQHSLRRLCPACGSQCVGETKPLRQCPNCTHLFDIERPEAAHTV